MNPSWYDVLGIEPTATTDDIRAAWRRAVADLDPTDRRFRVCNQAAEVLLDPARRTAYDAELAGRLAAEQAAEEAAGQPVEQPVEQAAEQAAEQEEEGDGQPVGATRSQATARHIPVVPGWVLVAVACALALALGAAGWLLTFPTDSAVADDTEAAQAAAERAIVPLLSYDAHHLDQSQAAAEPYLTADEKQQYDKLFAVIRQNAPRTGTVVRAKYVASGIVRSGTDRVDVLVFVDQVTRNKQHPKVPVVYRNQATVTMAKVGDTWLVDGLTTNTT